MPEEFIPETQQAVIIPDDDHPAPKQKRELTEAQRLAFLKAREARARNIAIRREQKMAGETTDAVPEKKPRAKKSSKRAAGELKEVEVKIEPTPEPMDHAPKAEETPAPSESEPQLEIKKEDVVMPSPEEYARVIADLIYGKLTTEPADDVPPPMPKVKRQRVRKTKPVVVEPAPVPEPEPEPEPAPAPAPTFVAPSPFGWM